MKGRGGNIPVHHHDIDLLLSSLRGAEWYQDMFGSEECQRHTSHTKMATVAIEFAKATFCTKRELTVPSRLAPKPARPTHVLMPNKQPIIEEGLTQITHSPAFMNNASSE